MYLQEVTVTHEQLKPNILVTLRYQATTDSHPTQPSTERPTDMVYNSLMQQTTIQGLPFCHGRCIRIVVDVCSAHS